MKHALAWIGICMCLQLFAGCVGEMSISGAGGQTTNGIKIGIVYPDGNPGTFLPVRVRPAGYLANLNGAFSASPRSVVNGITDEAGVFTADSLDGGAYVVEVNDGRGFAVAIVCHTPDSGGTVDAGTHTLAPTGVVRGHLSPEDLNGKSWYLQVYGLERATAVDLQTGAFAFTDMPAGRFTFRRISSNSAIAPIDFSNVQVRSNDTTTIPTYPLWSHNAVLTLNTTSSGAAVSGTVTNFPLLIRLNSANFPFGQAKSDGGDIRFTKSNGAPLSYEIERWDAGAQQAEVWVKIDTVYGNDSTHFFIMYWGDSAATSASNSAAVFDTGKGFQGVWHLGETDSLASDATGNRYNGTGYFTSRGAGMIGNALHFNGNSSVIRMIGTASSRLSFPMNGRYAVSAWVYHDTLADSVTYLIAGKGEHQYFIKNFDLELSIGQHARQWEFTEYHDNDWQSATFVPAAAKSWVYLVGVRDGSNEYLYVNGILAMNKMFAANQGQSSQDTSDDFAIGGFLRPVSTYNQGYAYFSGAIDEVTVSSTPRSADWVKLNYMNQKEKDALVRW